MNDITLCHNGSCLARPVCYRATAKPSYMQSYAIFEKDETGKCHAYIPISDAIIVKTEKFQDVADATDIKKEIVMLPGLQRLLNSSKALAAISAIISMVIAKKLGMPVDWNKIVEYGLYIVLVVIGSTAAEDFAAKLKGNGGAQ